MTKRIALLGLMVAIFLFEPAKAGQSNHFKFAETRIAGLDVQATTDVSWSKDIPTIADIDCGGHSDSVEFWVDRFGNISTLTVRFNGPPDGEGNRQNLALLGDHIWLWVDGRRYEHLHIPAPSDKFSNFDYKAEPIEEEIILVWRGYVAIKPHNRPVMSIQRIYSALVDAKKIEWGFKSRDFKTVTASPGNQLPTGWEQRRYTVESQGLRQAVDWCTSEVASSRARQLPAEYLQSP